MDSIDDLIAQIAERGYLNGLRHAALSLEYQPKDMLPQSTIVGKNADYAIYETTFLTPDALRCIAAKHKTPFYLYNGSSLKYAAERIAGYLSTVGEAHPYVSARYCIHPLIVQTLSDCGYGFRCESEKELDYICGCGVPGSKIRYASAVVSEAVCKRLRDMDAILVLGTDTNLPHILPRKVDLISCDAAASNKIVKESRFTDCRFGFNAVELAHIAAFLRTFGAESFGLTIHTEDPVQNPDFYGAKLYSVAVTAGDVYLRSKLWFDRFDVENGYAMDYDRSERLMEQCVINSLKVVKEGYKEMTQSLHFCVDARLLAPQAIFLTSVVGKYMQDQSIVIVNANASDLCSKELKKNGTVSLVGREWAEDRSEYKVAGLRMSQDDILKQKVMLRAPEIGDLMLFHDVGIAMPSHPEHPLLWYMDDGSVNELTV